MGTHSLTCRKSKPVCAQLETHVTPEGKFTLVGKQRRSQPTSMEGCGGPEEGGFTEMFRLSKEGLCKVPGTCPKAPSSGFTQEVT